MPERLLIEAPPTAYASERRYVLDVLIGEFLGLAHTLMLREGTTVRLRPTGAAGPAVVMPDCLFQLPTEAWLTEAALPDLPLPTLAVEEFGLTPPAVPVLFGPGGAPASAAGDLWLPADLFGGAFFMLTRYEEIARPDRDRHGRFPASASLAWRGGFLDRPVVNEYVEVLWAALARLYPRLARRKRSFGVHLSHDVDWPRCTLQRSPIAALRAVGADLLKRRDAHLALGRMRAHAGLGQDPYDTFEWLMATNERFGHRSAFYFITDQTAGRLDGAYRLVDAPIQALIRSIADRGHEIGLHPSYHTFRDARQTASEYEALRLELARLGVSQASFGGRQHYLRWENPTTWQNWSDAGLAYDSSLGFADRTGFRSGCCYEYPVFNLHTRKPLPLRERPLVAMDQSLFKYMRLDAPAALEHLLGLARACRAYRGDFTLVVHNSEVITRERQRWYTSVLEGLA